MIAIISCGAKKQNKQCKAKDMYIGTYFKKTYQTAKLFTNNVYILSAKYGLIKENEIIEPYEMSVNKMNKNKKNNWVLQVQKQIKDLGIQNEIIINLTGETYSIALKGLKTKNVLQKKGGMGKKMQYMNSLIQKGKLK